MYDRWLGPLKICQPVIDHIRCTTSRQLMSESCAAMSRPLWIASGIDLSFAMTNIRCARVYCRIPCIWFTGLFEPQSMPK